jgi:hypothetical protein
VVSSRPNTFEVGGRAAWVLLSDDPEEPSEVCIDGRHRRLENPGLEEMLESIDETDGGAGAARARAEGLLASVLIHSPS